MKSIPIIYYDGVVSKPHHATLYPYDQESVVVRYHDVVEKSHRYHEDQMNFIGAIGQRNPVIELENDARIELQSREVPDWIPVDHTSFHSKVWKLERTPSLILFSVVFILVLGFSVIKWGIPSAAKMIAFQLPENTLSRIGSQAEEYVNDYTKPTKLSAERQEKIKSDYLKIVAGDQPAHLKFRKGEDLGANALALPNNTIILTDELVEMAHSDQEIIGVLAHEQAHLLKRHSLQQAISSLGFSILYVAITGDSSDLVATLPIAVVGAGYSREFERESDIYALHLMHDKNIETGHFANLLQRMSEEAGEDVSQDEKSSQFPSVLDALSSHPATAERVKTVRDFEAKHQSNLQ